MQNYKTEEQKKQSFFVMAVLLVIASASVFYYITSLPLFAPQTENLSTKKVDRNLKGMQEVSGAFKVKFKISEPIKDFRVEKNINNQGEKLMEIVFFSEKVIINLKIKAVKPDFKFEERVSAIPQAPRTNMRGLSKNHELISIMDNDGNKKYRIVDENSRKGDTYLKQFVLMPIFGKDEMVINELTIDTKSDIDEGKTIDFLKSIIIE